MGFYQKGLRMKFIARLILTICAFILTFHPSLIFGSLMLSTIFFGLMNPKVGNQLLTLFGGYSFSLIGSVIVFAIRTFYIGEIKKIKEILTPFYTLGFGILTLVVSAHFKPKTGQPINLWTVAFFFGAIFLIVGLFKTWLLAMVSAKIWRESSANEVDNENP